jgi:hypothetical protein
LLKVSQFSSVGAWKWVLCMAWILKE